MKNDNIIVKSAKKTKKAVIATTNFFGITTRKTRSRFTYSLPKFYGYFIFYVFLSVITALMLAPYSYYKICELRYSHTFIDNKKVVFRGKVNDAYYQFTCGILLVILSFFVIHILKIYFLNDILNMIKNKTVSNLLSALISALPAFIISFFLINRLFVWSIQNIFFLSEGRQSFVKVSFLKLSIIKAVLSAVFRKLATLLTFGFGEPLVIVIKQRYIVNRQYVSRKKLRFSGGIFDSYKWFLWRYFLCFITLGFYYPVYLHKQYVWITMHTHLDDFKRHSIFELLI